MKAGNGPSSKMECAKASAMGSLKKAYNAWHAQQSDTQTTSVPFSSFYSNLSLSSTSSASSFIFVCLSHRLMDAMVIPVEYDIPIVWYDPRYNSSSRRRNIPKMVLGIIRHSCAFNFIWVTLWSTTCKKIGILLSWFDNWKWNVDLSGLCVAIWQDVVNGKREMKVKKVKLKMKFRHTRTKLWNIVRCRTGLGETQFWTHMTSYVQNLLIGFSPQDYHPIWTKISGFAELGPSHVLIKLNISTRSTNG